MKAAFLPVAAAILTLLRAADAQCDCGSGCGDPISIQAGVSAKVGTFTCNQPGQIAKIAAFKLTSTDGSPFTVTIRDKSTAITGASTTAPTSCFEMPDGKDVQRGWGGSDTISWTIQRTSSDSDVTFRAFIYQVCYNAITPTPPPTPGRSDRDAEYRKYEDCVERATSTSAGCVCWKQFAPSYVKDEYPDKTAANLEEASVLCSSRTLMDAMDQFNIGFLPCIKSVGFGSLPRYGAGASINDKQMFTKACDQCVSKYRPSIAALADSELKSIAMKSIAISSTAELGTSGRISSDLAQFVALCSVSDGFVTSPSFLLVAALSMTLLGMAAMHNQLE